MKKVKKILILIIGIVVLIALTIYFFGNGSLYNLEYPPVGNSPLFLTGCYNSNIDAGRHIRLDEINTTYQKTPLLAVFNSKDNRDILGPFRGKEVIIGDRNISADDLNLSLKNAEGHYIIDVSSNVTGRLNPLYKDSNLDRKDIIIVSIYNPIISSSTGEYGGIYLTLEDFTAVDLISDNGLSKRCPLQRTY